MKLKSLQLQLVQDLPEYEFLLKTRFGREVIIVKKDTFRGAEILKKDDRFQVIPMIPTTKGKMLFGSGIGWAKYFIKNYSEVSDNVYNYITEQELGLNIQKISTADEIELTEKGKKTDGYVTLFLGIGSIGLGIYLYSELITLEQNGGEFDIHWIIAIVYENLGKEAVLGVLAILGGYITYNGVKSLRKN